MNNMIFDDLPSITDISDEEINNNNNEWFKNIGEKTNFEGTNDQINGEIFSEQDIRLLEKINENENTEEMLINEIPDEIFFSSKINCITFFGVFVNSNSRSSVFIKSNVINPFSVYKGELHACGCIINY